jgi:Purine catabolism regulatory protein-like family.
MFTVEELIKKCCPQLKVLNSNADLTRQIFSADITETPDVRDYITDNTLVITTGMAFKDNPEQLAAFIEELNAKPVPALAIKLGRFIDTLPKVVLETANALQFPILLIPKESTLGAISHTILSYLWNSQVKTLSYAIAVQRDFSKRVLANAPVESLISQLAKMMNRSILFFDPFLQVDVQSKRDDVSSRIIDLTAHTIRNHYAKQQNRQQKKLFYISDTEGRHTPVSVFPVVVDPYQCYLLAVFNTTEIPYPFSELMLEQATTSLAFVIYKTQMVSLGDLKSKQRFFQLLCSAHENLEVFHSRLNNSENWHGVKKSAFYQVIVAGIDNIDALPQSEQVLFLGHQWLQIQIPKYFPDAAVFFLQDQRHYAIVLQSEPKSFSPLQTLSNELAALYPFTISCAIGNAVKSMDSIWFSYIKATETYNQAVKKGQTHFVEEYYARGLQDIAQLVPSVHAKHFSQYILKDLAFPRDEINQELKHTLSVFLGNQGDLTQTAKDLYIHRNTVRYRIEKIQQLLNADLSCPETSLSIRMALLFADT